MSDKPLYYAKDGMVWKSPVTTHNAHGSMSITIGFPVCKMHEAVGEDAAGSVAELMTRGDAAPDLVQVIKLAYDAMNYMGDILNGMDAVMPEDEQATTAAFTAVRAALEKHDAGSEAGEMQS